MIPLWDFQKEIRHSLRCAYRDGARSVLLVAPTGSGKTVMFCDMARNHIARGGRVLILVHRQELTQQVSETLTQFDVEHGFIAAGFPDRLAAVNIASVFTLAKRRIAWRPTLIIVDEAHHAVGSTTWGAILDGYPEAHVLGVTATPIRLSGEGLGESFEVLVSGPTTQELIDRGYLCRFRTFCPSSPDLEGVHKRMGEFVQAEVAARIDRPGITGDAVSHYRLHAEGRQAVAFCVSVEHAHHVAEKFKSAGYPAICIDGSMPSEWRRQIVADFKRRELKVLTSCGLIDEGFDCPGIEVDIDLAPTWSLGRHLQRRGRCLRIAPGKEDAVLLDCAGNILRHGLPTEVRQWSLNGRAVSKADSDAGASVRVCPYCFAAMPSTFRHCQSCGRVFPITPRKVPNRKGELREMTAEQIAAVRRQQEVGMTKDLETLMQLGQRRGYKDPAAWARHVLEGRAKKKARELST
jgi:superfamily II DNA or RNA helicase